jgi:hypothetical protein
MIALGLSWQDVDVPAPLSLRPAAGFGVILARQVDAATPKARLGLQARATLALPSFIPFAAAEATVPDRAHDWALQHTASLRETLERLTGACEMVLDLRQTGASPEQPRAWLQHRAARFLVPDRLAADLAPFAQQLARRQTALGATINVLIARSDQSGFAAALASACRDQGLSGWSAVLSGPWPPVSFHGMATP